MWNGVMNYNIKSSLLSLIEKNLLVFRIIHISPNFSPTHSIFFQTFAQLLYFSEHSPESLTSTTTILQVLSYTVKRILT